MHGLPRRFAPRSDGAFRSRGAFLVTATVADQSSPILACHPRLPLVGLGHPTGQGRFGRERFGGFTQGQFGAGGLVALAPLQHHRQRRHPANFFILGSERLASLASKKMPGNLYRSSSTIVGTN